MPWPSVISLEVDHDVEQPLPRCPRLENLIVHITLNELFVQRHPIVHRTLRSLVVKFNGVCLLQEFFRDASLPKLQELVLEYAGDEGKDQSNALKPMNWATLGFLVEN